MSCVLRLLRARPWSRAAVTALVAIGAAGCSSNSSRFSDNPLFPSGSPEVTGSISPTHPATIGRVESRPLPQPATSETANVGVSGGGRGMGSYSPPSESTTADRPGSVASKPAASGHWTWDGGTPVTVAQNENVETIARRYGVPASAIIQANGLTAAATVQSWPAVGDPALQSVADREPPIRPAVPRLRSSGHRRSRPPARPAVRACTWSQPATR